MASKTFAIIFVWNERTTRWSMVQLGIAGLFWFSANNLFAAGVDIGV
jgi:hypothetical protein